MNLHSQPPTHFLRSSFYKRLTYPEATHKLHKWSQAVNFNTYTCKSSYMSMPTCNSPVFIEIYTAFLSGSTILHIYAFSSEVS